MHPMMDARFVIRRLTLGLGLVLLVAGWSCTRYADAEMKAVSSGNEAVTVWTGERTKVSSWLGRDEYLSAKNLYRIGFLCMGIGTVVLVGIFPRGSWQASP